MDRNGKKPKATRTDSHPERSDTKTQARDTTSRMEADARVQRERGGNAAPGSAPTKRGGKGRSA